MLSFALGILLKATLVLSLGAIAERLWHKRGAEFRHAVLAIGVVGVLLVPFMSALLPAWHAPIPWFPPTAAVATLTAQARGPVSAALEAGPAAIGSARAGALSPLRGHALGSGASTTRGIVLAAALLWMGGALFVLVRLLSGQLGMQHVRRRAHPADSAEWRYLVGRAAADVGVTPEVSVLLSPEIGIPLTYGTLRPVVLLPVSADS